MAQRRQATRRRRRKRRDRTGGVLRLIIVLLILFIIGLVAWFIWHDRDLRTGTKALKKENYKEAVTAFDKSIKGGKNLSEAYRGKGIALYELGKYDEAAEDLIASIDQGGEQNAEIANLIALSLEESGNYEDAIPWLSDGITSASASDELIQQMRYHLVLCYEKTADWEMAKKTAESYTTDYPDDKKMAREYKFLQTR